MEGLAVAINRPTGLIVAFTPLQHLNYHKHLSIKRSSDEPSTVFEDQNELRYHWLAFFMRAVL